MVRFLKQVIGNEKGQVLPIVLALLVLGGLTIVPGLNYAATSLNHGRIINKNLKGVYAADAGVENALWCLKHSVSPPEQLSEDISQMEVTVQTEDLGTYTMYFGELIQAGGHSDCLSVDGEMAWVEEAQAYQYTITVTRTGGATTIHLTEVGARLPPGYSYQAGSAAGFAGNLSTGEPEEVLDSYGANMLRWQFAEPYPSVSSSNPVKTQSFYITGEGPLEGDYTWVVANREDIGEIGEINGDLYVITSTATEDGEVIARIAVDVMMVGETAHIISWKILK